MIAGRKPLKEILALPAVEAAPLLLGCYLVRRTPAGRIKVRIVETEAYHQEDPASHSFAGRTARTWPMFEAGGRLYVYFSYGMHYAINIVVGREGVGEGVLIRAAEPIEGIDIMRANRRLDDVRKLASGPGRLAQAMGIFDTSLSGKILNKSSILLEPGEAVEPRDIAVGSRVGVTKAAHQPWRFYLKDSPFVSKL